jgi:disulfide bond formation protein DsbB
MPMNLPSPRLLWSLIATGSIALVAGSFVLTAWLNLHPCHLCIFQRLLFMKLAVLFLLAAWWSPRPAAAWAGLLSLPIAAAGIAVATYQSWLQMQPPGSISCMAGEPGLIERLVEWLGQLQPDLFLATGFCEEAELSILGLSLANWALVSFTAFFGASVWALLRGRKVHVR